MGIIKKKKPSRQSLIIILLVVVGLFLLSSIIKDLYNLLVVILQNRNDETGAVSYVQAYGSKGVPLLFLLQVIQELVMIIPTTPITILCGLCYGPVQGMVISICGQGVGSAILFNVLRSVNGSLLSRFREKRVSKSTDEGFMAKLASADTKKLSRIVFILYLIPGLPGGVAPFIFCQTNISTLEFVRSMLLGTAPFTLAFILSGNSLSTGNWKSTVILIIIQLAIAAIVIKNRDRILDYLVDSEVDDKGEKEN